jgi:hypothetical protein
MKQKNFVSLMMAFGFLAIAVSGILMYFDLKPGPVKGIHVLFGLMLIGFAVFHILNNWGSLKLYMKDKGSGSIRKELVIGSLITGVVLVGAGFSIPPFPQIQRFGEEIAKEGGEKGRGAGRLMFETVSTNEKAGGQALSLIIQKKKDLVLPAMIIWTEDNAHHLLQNLFVPEKVASVPPGETDIREALEEGEVKFDPIDVKLFPSWAAAGKDTKSNHPATTPFDNFILESRVGAVMPAYVTLELVAGGKHAVYQAKVEPSSGKASSLTTSGEALLDRALLEWK